MQQKVVHVLVCFIFLGGFKVRNRYPKLMAFSRGVIFQSLIRMISRQKARNPFFYSLYVKTNMTAVVAPKIWLSPFEGHSYLDYDTDSDSSTPKTHHISVERNYPKKCIFEHIHIFLCMVYC